MENPMTMNIIEKYQQKGRLYPPDLLNASIDDLLQVKLLVDGDSSNIEAQLVEARGNAFRDRNQYADPEWYKNATIAKKAKGRLSQMIQLEIGRKRREAYAKKVQEDSELFKRKLLRAMDALLTPELKQKVIELARSY
jgi:hypothetical protein